MTQPPSSAIRLISSLVRSIKICKLLLIDHGLYHSFISRRPEDRHGNPLPWITYPAIEFLSRLDLKSCRIFEYGGGGSTLFWASRCHSVTTVESDSDWLQELRRAIPDNVNLILAKDKETYCNAIEQGPAPFDLIIVDGKWRNACLRRCPEFLSPGGMIILDDSERDYTAAAELQDAGFFQIDFSGLSPITAYASATSIFIRANTSFHRRRSATSPIGGLGTRAGPDD